MMEPKRQMTPEEARKDHWLMLRFMVVNAAFGIFLGLMLAALIIGFDLGGIGTRITRAETPLLPIVLIALPLALLFGAAVAASAIWLMPYERKYAPEPRKDENDQ
jgi:hypothetical protein